ncbi:amidohydrolase family protein [Egicoccus sp. AB-alg6-2]|uniref:amidohydrolase family protein n=1 Tax=Egicoccus sp. AB-alg6-2 TaxID=3242692 RepID=UPI00359D4DE6
MGNSWPAADADTVVPREAFPSTDGAVAGFARSLGLPGYLDIHVHLLPHALQRAVWDFFDRLEDPPWPVTYRDDEARRLATLRELGVVAHTALAYGHRPGVAAWCNQHTLAAADAHAQVIPTFTFFPEDGVGDDVGQALQRGGRIAKVHLQVGRFHPDDPRLDPAWAQLVEADVPALVHAGAGYGVEGGHEVCGPDGIRRLLRRFPGLRLVVAHLGAPDLRAFLALAEEAPQIHLDTAMMLTDPPYLAAAPRDLLPRYAALGERLLFGSDFPTIPHPYAAQVRGLAALELTVQGLRGLLHDNAARLLGLPTAADRIGDPVAGVPVSGASRGDAGHEPPLSAP